MTAKNPENQSDFRPRSGIAGGKNIRPRTTSQGQRIFVSGDKIVEKPPVLFRMPSIKLATAGTVETAPKDGEKPESSVAPESAAPTQATPENFAKKSTSALQGPTSPHLGPRAPHFISSADESGASDVESGQALTKKEVIRWNQPAGPEIESQKVAVEQDRTAERTPRAQRTSPIPEVVPVPSGRGWMEIISSRLVIALLVAAIAAVAIFANRESTPRSAAELAILELGDSDNVTDKAENAQLADKPLTSNSRLENSSETNRNELLRSSMTTVPSAGGLNSNGLNSNDLNEPVLTAQAPTRSPEKKRPLDGPTRSNDPQSIEPVEPDFDLSELMKPASDQESSQASQIPNPSDGDWQQDLEQLGAEMQAGGERPNPLSSNSTFTNQLDRGQVSLNPTEIARPDGNRFISEPGMTNYGGVSEDEAAIRAAIDAAMLDRTSEARNVNPRVAETSQPAGISDWSKYLPSNPQHNSLQPNSAPFQPNMVPPQQNMIPPGTINPPNGYQGGYPAQSFTNGQAYPNYSTDPATAQYRDTQQAGSQPRTAMLPGNMNNNPPQTVNGFTIPPIGYGQPNSTAQPGVSGPNGMQNGAYPGSSNPTNQYPSSFADPNRR